MLKEFTKGKAVCANCKHVRGITQYEQLKKCAARGEGVLLDKNCSKEDRQWVIVSRPNVVTTYRSCDLDAYPSFPHAAIFNSDGSCDLCAPKPPLKEVINGKWKQLIASFAK